MPVQTELDSAVSDEAFAILESWGVGAMSASNSGGVRPSVSQSEIARFLESIPTGPGLTWSLPRPLDLNVCLIALASVVASVHVGLQLGQPADNRTGDKARHGVLPVFERLGMWDARRSLKDDLLRWFDPASYSRTSNWMRELSESTTEVVTSVTGLIESAVLTAGVDAQVQASFCTVEGAHRRLINASGVRSVQIGDLVQIELVVPTVSDCYPALGVIHNVGIPQPMRFSDLVAAPRVNGHSGLFTSVLIKSDALAVANMFDLVVQTALMSAVARRGVTETTCYRSLVGTGEAPAGADTRCARALIEGLLPASHDPRTAGSHHITVFTRGVEGRRLDHHSLDAGATVLDLAYLVHTDIGNAAVSATVNGAVVELGHRLRHTDLVEIVHNRGSGVRSEADTVLVETKRARVKMRAYLNSDPVRKGRHLVAQYVRRRGLPLATAQLDQVVARVLPSLIGDYEDVEHLYRSLARHESERTPAPDTARSVGAAIVEQRRGDAMPSRDFHNSYTLTREKVPRVVTSSTHDAALRLRFCGVCQPYPGSAIAGISSRSKVTVHLETCYHIRGRATTEMEWVSVDRAVKSHLELECHDRPLLVHAITEIIYRRSGGLEVLVARALEFGRATVSLDVYTRNAVSLVELMEDLQDVRSVLRVQLLETSLPALWKHQIAAGPLNSALKDQLEARGYGRRRESVLEMPMSESLRDADVVIPYHEHKPTFSADYFFGRSQMAADLRSLTVDSSAGGIAVLFGARRIGKTSLALRFLDQIPEEHRPHHVHIDLRSFVKANRATLLGEIAGKIERRFGTRNRISRDDTPERRIERVIEESEREVVLVLDELGGPLDAFACGSLDAQFFLFIRELVEAQRRLSVVLIAPPTAEAQLRETGVFKFLGPIPSLRLNVLASADAAEMVVTPFRQQGVRIDQSGIDVMVSQTGGHPYFIIGLQKEVAGLLRRSRAKVSVTARDVARAIDGLLLDQPRFATFVDEHASDAAVLACLHALARVGESARVPVSAPALREAVHRNGSRLSTNDIDRALDLLIQFQVVNRIVSPQADTQYRFVVPLLRSFIRRSER